MFSKSSIASNMAVYEDLVINQMGFDKSDEGFAKDLILWWGDQKIEVQIISMQGQGIVMDRSYDWYQQILAGLALWHLRFKFLKMVWELFYPGRAPTKQSALQWAADHWQRDKTTKPTDFYSLEDLTIHSYRSRIVAILMPWIEE